MLRTNAILKEQNENLALEIEQLQDQLIINKYLSENIFIDSLLVDGKEQALFENMIKNRVEHQFKSDCEMCNNKDWWQDLVQNDEWKDLDEDQFDRKLYTLYCDYCSAHLENPMNSFEHCERLRAMNFAYECKDKMNGEMKDKFSDEDNTNLKEYIDWILSDKFTKEDNEHKHKQLEKYMEDKGIKFI